MPNKEKTSKGIEECHEIYYDFQTNIRVGDYDYVRPDPPDVGDVFNFGLEKDDRKFPLHDRDIIDTLSESELIEFVAEEQRRLDEGIHFYNGNQLEYVTGKHYFMLQWWIIPSVNDGTYTTPDFIDAQRDTFYHWDCTEKDKSSLGAVWGTCRRFGKALCVDTDIPTPNGFVKMKDLEVGDKVFDENGKPCNITYVTGLQVERVVNRVWFDDGTYLDADDDHQWEVMTYNCRRGRGKKNKGSSDVLTTKQMKQMPLMVYSRERNFHIKISKPTEYKYKNLPIDPYLFGYWLGDGGSYNSKIHCGELDLHNITEYLDDLGINYVSKKCRTAYEVTLLGTYKSTNKLGQFTGTDGMLSKLKKLGFIKKNSADDRSKKIPEIYKHSSISQRQELIRGLMDSDGSIGKNGKSIEITQKSKALSDDIAEVLRSLGEKCVIETKIATMRRSDDSMYRCEVYRINTMTKFNPFRLKRKSERWHYPKSKRRFVKSIEKIEVIDSKPVKCISVDSKNSLYLAGKSYTVTHNTSVGGAICYTTAMMLEGAKCAIQSKTNKDAVEVFLKIQESWQRLPDFFKPIDTGETKRSNAIYFTAPQKKSSKGEVKEYQYVLDSWIKPFPANNMAQDGLGFRFGYYDEEGKVEKGVAEVDERWEVNSKCFMSRDKVVGKSLHTTTVEDMERFGGARFKKIWDNSNVKTLDPLLGRTISGLRKLFIPADYGYKVDEWGYSDREYARRFHEAEMARLSGSELISYRRKYPLRESDMWLMESTASPWALAKIQQQSQYNEDEGIYAENRRGNFYWKNGEENEVGFQEDKENGRWTVAWMPPTEDRNQYRISEYGREPTREHVRIGIDPTNLKAPVVGSGSDNAAYAVLDIGYMGNKTPKAVCEYLYRQDHPTDFAEDMRMMAVFYSARVFVENNAGSVLIRHFENKRCEEYLMYNELEKDQKKKFKERGFYNATNGGIRENLVNVTRAHIVDDIGYIELDQTGSPAYGSMPFPNLIEDLQDFEVDNWTPYDATVAYMIAILACKMSRMNIDTSELSAPADFNVMSFHKIYKVK